MKWNIIVATVVTFLLPIPSAAVSEDVTSDPVAEFNRGVALYREGSYTEAAAAFRRADQLKPTWSLLYNIAQSEAAAKNYGSAYEAFEAYLSKGGDELPNERQSEVIAEINRLKNLIGSLEISAPEGATVKLDGSDRGTTPLPGTLKLGVGVVHSLVIEQNGAVLLSEKVKVSQGEIVHVAVAAPKQGADSGPAAPFSEPPATADADTSAKEKKSASPMKIVGWTGIGVGLSLLAGGAATGGIALSIGNELEASCNNDICPSDRLERKQTKDALALSTDILLGVGIVTAGVGVGLLIASLRGEKRAASKQQVVIAPMIGASAAAISVSGRF